jgi:hypothetical protein
MQFIQEIRESYRLLFVVDQRSNKVWQQKEKAQAAEACGGACDPALEFICSHNLGRTSRTIYSPDTDFPIFKQRLYALQTEMLNQHPNHFKTLWHDRRDLLRWSQFWIILILGCVGLLLNIVQTIFTIVQTVYSIRGGPES